MIRAVSAAILMIGLGTYGPLTASAAPAPTGQPPTTSQSPTTGVTPGADKVDLLAQTPWVGPGASVLNLRLHLQASDPTNERLTYLVYDRLTTRSGLESSFQGHIQGLYYYDPSPKSLGELQTDPAGGVDLSIPVNQITGGLPLGPSGVYPLQVFLVNNQGVTMGTPLETDIVYADSTASSLPRLSTALVVPFPATVQLSATTGSKTLSASSTSAIDTEASVVAGAQVPLTFGIGAAAVEALKTGSSADKAALDDLKTAARHDQLLDSPAVPLNMPALVKSDLISELNQQIAQGTRTLKSDLGVAPSDSTGVFTGGLDAQTARALADDGIERFVLPSQTLTPLSGESARLTFANPTHVDIGDQMVDVLTSDPELSSHFAPTTDPALAANQLLADLAMTDLEAPNAHRGIVIAPPSNWQFNPTLFNVLLSGLQGNPFLQPATINDLFKNVPLAMGYRGPLVRELSSSHPTEPGLRGVDQLKEAQQAVTAMTTVFGSTNSAVQQLSNGLNNSLSSVYTDSRRQRAIAEVLSSADQQLQRLTLPSSVSITLTARNGKIPLTVVSDSSSQAHVQLRFASQKLAFEPYDGPGVHCTPMGEAGEQCQLVLTQRATTLQVPVSARSSGVFSFSVELLTPDGSDVLARGRDTVRSTAVSGVGVVLLGGAVVFLAWWWTRDLRRRRRKLHAHTKHKSSNSHAVVTSGHRVD